MQGYKYISRKSVIKKHLLFRLVIFWCKKALITSQQLCQIPSANVQAFLKLLQKIFSILLILVELVFFWFFKLWFMGLNLFFLEFQDFKNLKNCSKTHFLIGLGNIQCFCKSYWGLSHAGADLKLYIVNEWIRKSLVFQ
jgi:hypothetical protein